MTHLQVWPPRWQQTLMILQMAGALRWEFCDSHLWPTEGHSVDLKPRFHESHLCCSKSRHCDMLPSVFWDPPQANKLTTKQMLAGVFWSNCWWAGAAATVVWKLGSWMLGPVVSVCEGSFSCSIKICIARGVNQSENLRISFPKSIWSWMAGSCLARNVWFVGSHGGHKGFGTSMEELGKIVSNLKDTRH